MANFREKFKIHYTKAWIIKRLIRVLRHREQRFVSSAENFIVFNFDNVSTDLRLRRASAPPEYITTGWRI